ncbi:YfbU family protein [Sinorhizobium meliloti]|uniref:YfbU family protein n=1 Tax=Rhizobium meliloti TaxID=382 RepID=UPI000FDAE0E8|nr:YfbU family protein [Sinorhizobium meliloti]MDW9928053.1 hypothetical protein [Sinorhizobium meliloti]MDX0964781.1 hypothetical protein [Sinorhizobium medicae]RVI54936.1 hypothetical protein CN195_04770 [Sinorhizobium meliloti]
MSLSYSERLILANQYAILEKLDVENALRHRNAREIVERGYEYLYDTLSPLVEPEFVPAAVGREVCDILDMFRAVEQSATDIGKAASELGANFEGFDPINAHAHYRFCEFVRHTLHYWQDLTNYPDTSHDASSLLRYRAMLLRWKYLGAPSTLSEAQIAEIAGIANASSGTEQQVRTLIPKAAKRL